MDIGIAEQRTTTDLKIQGMTCASCAGRVERSLRRLAGVEAAEVNLATERARVTARGLGVEALIAAVREAGYDAVRAGETSAAADAARSRRELMHVLIAAALSTPLLAGMIQHLLGGPWMLPGWLQFALATPVQFWLGGRFYLAGWRAVRAGSGNMDLLVALGTTAAWGLSVAELLLAAPGREPLLYFEVLGPHHHLHPAG